jgi:hypothetical protein
VIKKNEIFVEYLKLMESITVLIEILGKVNDSESSSFHTYLGMFRTFLRCGNSRYVHLAMHFECPFFS